MAVQFTKEENCLKELVCTFYEYSTGDSNKETLTVDEFKKMVKHDFPNLMKDRSFEELMKTVDKNKDNEMKFSEYWTVIGSLAKECKREEKKKH
ncbi:protein S100-A13 [Lissotriton helveticus]